MQQHLDVRELAVCHERSDIPHAQDRPNLKQLIGKQLEPASHGRFLARPAETRDRHLDHAGGSLEVLPSQSVANGVVRFATLLEPAARAPVEVEDAVRLLAHEARTEDIREQVVVSVPLAPRVERDQEEIPPIEDLEHALAAIQSRDRIAQRAGQPLEDARPQKEPADILGLSLQDLLGEVVDDEAIVSSETRDEGVDVVAALHRQGGKLEGGDPALRPLLQRGDLARIEVQIGRLIQVRRGLVTREAQIRGS